MQFERRPYPGKGGEQRISKRWSVRFYDHRGMRHWLSLFERKAASEHFGQRLQRLVDAKAGGEPLSADLLSWVSGLSASKLQKLIKWQIVDPRRISSTVPIEEHIDAWKRSIEHNGRTPAHTRSTVSRVTKAFRACAVQRWADIDCLTLQDWLSEQTGPDGWSDRVHNAYVQSLSQFTGWMVAHQHAVLDPLQLLDRRSEQNQERRRERRALSVEESRGLVQTTEQGGLDVAGVRPEVRGMLYRLALQTALRQGELFRLEVGWIEFGEVYLDQSQGSWVQKWRGKPTTITPPAKHTKAGRKTGRVDTIVVPLELHARLLESCRNRHPRARVFESHGARSGIPGAIRSAQGSQMIKQDLAAAGISYVDDAGRYVDFHALRHTALTIFASTNPSFADMLKFARHSNPKVTQRYLHSELESQSAAVNDMPSLDGERSPDGDSESLRKVVGLEFTGPTTGPPSAPERSNESTVRGEEVVKMRASCDISGDLQSIALPLGHAASEAENIGGDGSGVEGEPPGVGVTDTAIRDRDGESWSRSWAHGQSGTLPHADVGASDSALDPTPEDRRALAAQSLENDGQDELAGIVRAWGRLAGASRRAIAALAKTLDEGSGEGDPS